MPRVLVVGKIHDDGVALLRSRPDLEVVILDDPGAPIPENELSKVDAVLIRYGVLTEKDVQVATRLRVVSRHGVGCDNLPLAALSARGIPVTIVGPVNAVSVAEQAITMMLCAMKRIGQYDRAVRRGHWGTRDSLAAVEVSGKTLMLLGFGRIGREVARRARAFELKVVAFDPYVSAEVMRDAGVARVAEWHDELEQVDILSLHLPLSADTRNIIDGSVLGRLKSDAILINTARGGLIDEAALHTALTTRMADGAACLDTFAVEPPAVDHPLLQLANVVLSPHSASLTPEAARRMGIVAAQNVIAGLDGCLEPALVFNRLALEAARAGHLGRVQGTANVRP